MKRISIERYKTPTEGYAGCIEGENDEGRQWILFLDESGTPEIYWPNRDPEGAVVGQPIPLSGQAILASEQLREAKLMSILDAETPENAVKRLREAYAAAQEIRSGERELPQGMDESFRRRNEQVFGRPVSAVKPTH